MRQRRAAWLLLVASLTLLAAALLLREVPDGGANELRVIVDSVHRSGGAGSTSARTRAPIVCRDGNFCAQ